MCAGGGVFCFRDIKKFSSKQIYNTYLDVASGIYFPTQIDDIMPQNIRYAFLMLKAKRTEASKDDLWY